MGEALDEELELLAGIIMSDEVDIAIDEELRLELVVDIVMSGDV